MCATTDPQRMAFPLGVISPSHKPKVPKPDAKAAWRSDQVDEMTKRPESFLSQNGEPIGATAW